MRILITGAAGFIGRPLVQQLVREHEVFGLSRKPSAPARSIQMDLSVGVDLRALPQRIDAVVHLAQSEYFREFPERADHIYAVNVESVFRLLEYARQAGASRFVLASSGGIYGYAKEAVIESAEPHPPDFYLRSKQLAEVLLFAYDRFFTTIAVRPFFVYGVGQRPTMFIPRLVRNVLLGRPITLSPPDGLLVNPIHVDDAVKAFSTSLTADFAGPINVAGPDVVSLGQIVRMIGGYLDREPVTERVADAPGNVVGDVTLMSRILGPPTVRFNQGVVDLCREAAAEPATEGR
jgi:nucleoside-diphosphate-sugar epimerase